MADKIANVALSNNHPLNILIGNWTPWGDLYTDISCLGGYLRKIQVERRKTSRAEGRGKFSLKTGIFRKYPSQT